jgi:hypothetical protein
MLMTDQASAKRRRKQTGNSRKADRKDTTMQATTENNAVKRTGFVAVVLATLAIALVGANAVQDAPLTGSDARPAVVTRSNDRADYLAHIRYLEQNTMFPTGATIETRSYGDIMFAEQNTLLPTGTTNEVRSYSDTLFLEQNTTLPEAPSVPLTFERIRFLEMNQLPAGELIAPEIIRGSPS